MDKEDKRISVTNFLKEFESRYNQQPARERDLLEVQPDKVTLFIKASDRSYQEKLDVLLKD